MGAFLEQRFPVEISYGSSFNHSYNVDITEVKGGDEYRVLNNPFIKLEYDVIYEHKLRNVMADVVALYDKAIGPFKGFRVKDLVDFTTNPTDGTLPHAATDQFLPLANPTIPNVYQMTKWYGDPSDIYCARRRIRKPVASTALLASGGVTVSPSLYSVDYLTGIITTPPNESANIAAITKGSSTVVGLTNFNPFEIGDMVTVSGVLGTVELNGLRAEVTAVDPGTPLFQANIVDLIIAPTGVQLELDGMGAIVVGTYIIFSDIVGTTQLNGLILKVTEAEPLVNVIACLVDTTGWDAYISGGEVSTLDNPNVTLNVNSASFTDYISGGKLETYPANGFTFGCEFDIPCRFAEDFKGTFPSWEQLSVSGLNIIEILNP